MHRLPPRDADRDDQDQDFEQLELVASTPPTWEELSDAHFREEELRSKLEQLKTQVKIAKLDWDSSVLVLRQLGRRMRNRRVDPLTGEILGTRMGG